MRGVVKMMRMAFREKKLGFTLIELLLVVSIIGVLSGVLLTVINPTRQNQYAQDGVRRANIEKLAQAIEAYCAAEGYCPSRNDMANVSSVVRTTYIKVWPTDTTYTYLNNVAGAATTTSTAFEINAQTAINSAMYIRYNSVWGKIQECTNATVSSWASPSCL